MDISYASNACDCKSNLSSLPPSTSGIASQLYILRFLRFLRSSNTINVQRCIQRTQDQYRRCQRGFLKIRKPLSTLEETTCLRDHRVRSHQVSKSSPQPRSFRSYAEPQSHSSSSMHRLPEVIRIEEPRELRINVHDMHIPLLIVSYDRFVVVAGPISLHINA